MGDRRACVAVDCEMVGIGFDGNGDMLARVSVVDERGGVLYDTFVAPQEKVVNYRTPVSGVRRQDLIGAPDFVTVQETVRKLMKDKILVGQSIDHDLEVLDLDHPLDLIRDTAEYPPFFKYNRGRSPSLRKLAQVFLGRSIQRNEHSSIEDARAVMEIYQLNKVEWERRLSRR